jgi:hypothetical protein
VLLPIGSIVSMMGSACAVLAAASAASAATATIPESVDREESLDPELFILLLSVEPHVARPTLPSGFLAGKRRTK